MATNFRYLTEHASDINLNKLTTGYKFSHTFKPEEHSVSTYANGNTLMSWEPGFYQLFCQSFHY